MDQLGRNRQAVRADHAGPRQLWDYWQSWQRVVCNLQAVKGVETFDPHSLLAWLCSLIHWENAVPALATRNNILLDVTNDKMLSWMRQAPGAPVVIFPLKFTAESQTAALTVPGVTVPVLVPVCTVIWCILVPVTCFFALHSFHAFSHLAHSWPAPHRCQHSEQQPEGQGQLLRNVVPLHRTLHLFPRRKRAK